MEVETAQSLLTELLLCLPTNKWYALRQKNRDDKCIATALERPSAEIDALLVNASICNETPRRISLNNNNWELYCRKFDGDDAPPIYFGTIDKVIYVSNGEPDYDKPAKQIKAMLRNIPSCKLSKILIQKLKSSCKDYENQKKKKTKAAQKKKKTDDEADALAAKKKAIRDRFPMLASAIGEDEDITTKSPKVQLVLQNFLREIVQLNLQGKDGTTTSSTSKKRDFDSTNNNESDINVSELAATLYTQVVDIDVEDEDDVDTETAGTTYKRTKYDRSGIRAKAAWMLAPQFVNRSIHDIETLPWDSSKLDEVNKSQQLTDQKDTQAMLISINRGNPVRAAANIHRFLTDKCNKDVNDLVMMRLAQDKSKEKEAKDAIIGGIKDSIEHNTKRRGVRYYIQELYVKFVVFACMFRIVQQQKMEILDSTVRDILGCTYDQIKTARTKITEVLASNKPITAYARKRRKDYIRDRLKKFIWNYLMDDDVTRLDTNQSKVLAVNPSTGQAVEVHRRIWLHTTNKELQHQLFLQSDHYQDFKKDNPDSSDIVPGPEEENSTKVGVGYTVWMECLAEVGNFVSNPINKSCVDRKISGLEHVMMALMKVLKIGEVKKALNKFQPGEHELTYNEMYALLRKAGAYQFIDGICCPKKPEADCHIDKSKPCPEFLSFECTHGKDHNKEDRCKQCGFAKMKRLLDTLLDLPNYREMNVEVMVWKPAKRAGGTAEDPKTQMELQPETVELSELVKKLEEQLDICLPHYQEIRWMKWLMDTDFAMLPEGTLLIFTDFASSMSLRANEAINSSVNAHAVNDNFVCISNRRIARYKIKDKDKNGVVVEKDEEQEIFTCDVYHFFAETFSKGKKNDHAMHNACLDRIIEEYKVIFEEEGTPLDHVVVWTDNAPNQYCCRQNFIKVASFEERHPGIRITHNLAVPDNFKGNHDAVGKDPSIKVRMLEELNIRSRNAFEVFLNMSKYLASEREDSEWIKFENEKNASLRFKGRHGMDSRRCRYVTETQLERQVAIQKAPESLRDHIILCDRSHIQDTNKRQAVAKSHKIHQVKSTVTDANLPKWPSNKGPREWNAQRSFLPCYCVRCNDANDIIPCKFAPWRNTKDIVMKEAVKVDAPVPTANPAFLSQPGTSEYDMTAAPFLTLGSTAAPNSDANDTASDNNEQNNNDTNDGDDDDEEDDGAWWEVKKVYSNEEVMRTSPAPVNCQTPQCNLVACALWQKVGPNLLPQELEEWNTCMDCQTGDNGFGGWPYAEDLPDGIDHMSTNHRIAFASKCSKDHNWKHHQFPHGLPFEERSRR